MDNQHRHLTVVDDEFKIVETNSAFVAELGASSTMGEGRDFAKFFPKLEENGLIEEMRETLVSGVIKSGEIKVQSDDRHKLILAYECSPKVENRRITGVVFQAYDVTENRRKECQFALQNRMANLGKLAADIAHEINNPLEAILNRIGCLLMEDFQKAGVERLRKELMRIQEQVYEISSTTNALSAFSKETSERFRRVNVNSVVKKSVELCRLYHPKPGVRLKVELSDNLSDVLASEIGLEQCFVNIINNAIEASSGDGIIKLETFLNKNNKREVVIMISDRGCGIPKENLDKVFEPFFSTKGIAHGSGLGLSISYGIIADHGGNIDIESELDKGTTVKISIPGIIEIETESGVME